MKFDKDLLQNYLLKVEEIAQTFIYYTICAVCVNRCKHVCM